MTKAIGKTTKSEKIEIRINKSDKEKIRNAALKSGMSQTEFVRKAAIRAANRINSADSG